MKIFTKLNLLRLYSRLWMSALKLKKQHHSFEVNFLSYVVIFITLYTIFAVLNITLNYFNLPANLLNYRLEITSGSLINGTLNLIILRALPFCIFNFFLFKTSYFKKIIKQDYKKVSKLAHFKLFIYVHVFFIMWVLIYTYFIQ